MPYVQRNQSQQVIGIFEQPQPGYAEEFLADDHADVVAFLTPPITATPLQVRRALLAAGLLATVEAIVESAGGETKIAWDWATEFRSDSPMLLAMAQQLDPPLDAAAVRALFEQARSLQDL